MNIRTFKAANLFSIGKEVEIDLADRGLVLVTGYSEDEKGANGAGKSTLANKGILWTLYGQTLGGIKSDQVINRHTKGKTFGEVEFMSGGTRFRVRRERPAKLSFEILEEGQWLSLSARDSKMTQALIDANLKKDFKTFSQTSCFGQGTVSGFLEATASEQKNILESILPIKEVSYYAQKAKELQKPLQETLATLQIEKSMNKGAINNLEGNIKKLKANSNYFEINRSEKEKKLKHHIELLQEDLKKDIPNIPNMQKVLKNKQAKMSNLSDKIKEIDIARDNHGKSMDALNKWKSERNDIAKRLTFLNNFNKTECPECSQVIGGDKQEEYRKEILLLNERAVTATNTVRQCEQSLEYYQDKITSLREEINANQTLEKEINEISKLIAHFTNLKSNIKIMLRNETVLYLENKAEENVSLGYLNDAEKEFKTKKKHLEATIKKITKVEKEIANLSFWVDGFSKGIKLEMLNAACPYLEHRTEYHLNKLQNSQISVKFNTEKKLKKKIKEEFDVEVVSSTGGTGYTSLSGGEQDIVSFAVGLALSDLAESQDSDISEFLIIDEPFKYMDARNAEAVTEYLTREIEKKTILLISNEPSLKELITNQISVVKQNGITQIAS